MKILIIDNYDSFTYNLYQYVGELLQREGDKPAPRSPAERDGVGFVLDVVRNDKITLAEIKKRKYDKIILSPGPGDPSDKTYFGVCADVLTQLGKKIPVLGVCLGMQGMAHYFGGRVKRALKPMHGKTSVIKHDGKGVFRGLPQGLEVMRYHSLVADRESLPGVLEITAVALSSHPEAQPKDLKGILRSAQNDMGVEIMGLRHKQYPIEGIQFHPESFATEGGKQILENFLFRV